MALLASLLGGNTPVGAEAPKHPYSSLALSIRRGNASEVIRLLDAGTPVDERSGRYQETPLMVAARRGTLDLVKMLLARGANVNASSPYAGTALHAAAYRGRLDICQALIAAGADVNAPNEEGWTVLHQVVTGAPDYARLSGQHVEVARLLLEKGAKLEARTRGGLTPLDMLQTRCSGERKRLDGLLRQGIGRK